MNRILILLIFSLTIVGCRQKSFDSDEWKKNKDSQYWMLDDLVESEILVGKTKKQIIELIDTVDIKQYSYSNDIWMIIIGKPEPTPSTQSPVEVLDLFFENEILIKAEKRKK